MATASKQDTSHAKFTRVGSQVDIRAALAFDRELTSACLGKTGEIRNFYIFKLLKKIKRRIFLDV